MASRQRGQRDRSGVAAGLPGPMVAGSMVLLAWSWSTLQPYLRSTWHVGATHRMAGFHVAPSTWLIAIGLGLLVGALDLSLEPFA